MFNSLIHCLPSKHKVLGSVPRTGRKYRKRRKGEGEEEGKERQRQEGKREQKGRKKGEKDEEGWKKGGREGGREGGSMNTDLIGICLTLS